MCSARPQTTSLLVSTEDHASEVVAAQLPLLLLPDDPDAVQTFIAAHDRELRDSVSEQGTAGECGDSGFGRAPSAQPVSRSRLRPMSLDESQNSA